MGEIIIYSARCTRCRHILESDHPIMDGTHAEHFASFYDGNGVAQPTDTPCQGRFVSVMGRTMSDFLMVLRKYSKEGIVSCMGSMREYDCPHSAKIDVEDPNYASWGVSYGGMWVHCPSCLDKIERAQQRYTQSKSPICDVCGDYHV